jgi:hypothetical protein
MGQTYWNRSYEAIPYDKIGKIIPTRDCNFIAIGSFDNKACIVKMSPYGDSLWTRLSDGDMGTTGFSSITPAHDGDFIAVGCNQNKVTMMKIKPTGEIVWTKVYTEGGLFYYADVGITPLADGNFVAMGCNESYKSAWFFKFDSEGKVIQNKILPINFRYGCLVAKSDGSFLVAGNPVYRISCTGEILNSYYVPDIGTEDVNEIKMLPDESFVVLGTNGSEATITQLDKAGKVTFSHSYPGVMAIHSFAPTADCRLLAVGRKRVIRADSSLGSEPIILKLDKNGDILWTKQLSSLQTFWAIARANNGMFIAGGMRRGMLDGQDILFTGIIDDQYARKGSLFRFKIPVSGNPFQYSYRSLDVPPGMNVSDGGTISWIPQTDSSYMENAEFLVTDDSGNKDTLTFNIFVNSKCNSGGLRFLEDIFVKKGSLFSFKLSFFGDSLNYRYHSLNFPAGMNISTGGTISWVPASDCLYNVQVLESDSLEKDTISFTVSVNSYNIVTALSPDNKNSSTAMSRDFTIKNSTTNITFSFPPDTRQLAIYDIHGRLLTILQNSYGQSELQIVNKTHYPAGRYIARVTGPENTMSKQFFMYR